MIKNADNEHIVLVDASKLGEIVKEGKNQRTVLTKKEEQKIISAMNDKMAIEDFSIVVKTEDIKAKNYSFSAGQYFEVKIEYIDITPNEFAEKMNGFENRLTSLFRRGNELDVEIQNQLKTLKYE
ncbi:N-6 DNA methylase [Chryseobacterium sp. P1-3]|uniref:N-6 DNA methylase n=1 Tax=Chryseobacterium sp. (strain P1-3) TaxID=1517683 RepID=UPI000A4D0634|nr:N-6 DNA methylase [Chryseobacterium sp. P1-3]